MATYKLIQNIEAEDKILGPLTLRQFIFALVAAFFLYLSFISITKGWLFLLVVFLPPVFFAGFFAFPFGRDQPTEIWALGKLNFWFKPRKRVWNQSGVKELVTINVPKKMEHVFTDGLTQNEVQSRLKALASTIDSHGWAIKNLDTYTPQVVVSNNSDRLIGINNLPQEVPGYRTAAADDILDAASNPVARQFKSMINKSTRDHRQQLIAQLNTTEPTAASGSQWFMSNSQSAAQTKAAGSPTKPDDGLTLIPSGGVDVQTAVSRAAPQPAAPVTVPGDPAILSLAKNNDLNVATLAREAYKAKNGNERPRQDEVVISLH
jgi:hypothetical protein